MLRLYDTGTGRVEEIVPARAGVVRVACAPEPRPLVVGDLIRRLLAHHRLRTIGVWEPVPGAEELGVRPAELSSGDADVHVGPAVGGCSLAPFDGVDPLAVRLALLRGHYRAELSLGPGELAEADAALTAWRRTVAGWAESPGRPPNAGYAAEAVAALDADLDTPSALATLTP